MPVTLMRHAQTDWARVNALRLRGAANDLASLTATGRDQARQAARTIARPEVIIASPMTRALETASIIGTCLGVEVLVQFDLREWLPDESYSWTTSDEVLAAYDDMRRHGGVRPDIGQPKWEPLATVRARAAQTLDPFVSRHETVLAVTHEVVIYALTAAENTSFCATRPYCGAT